MAFVAQTLLAAIEQLTAAGREATCASLSEAAGLTHRQVADSCAILVRRELISRLRPGCYQMTDAGRLALAQGDIFKSGPRSAMPRTRTRGLRLKAWRLMRNKQKFSLNDLCQVLCDGSEQAAESNLNKYLRTLHAAGFLTRLPRRERGTAPTSNGQYRYLLVRDSGPLPPVWRQKSNSVFDPNTQEEYALNPTTVSEDGDSTAAEVGQ